MSNYFNYRESVEINRADEIINEAIKELKEKTDGQINGRLKKYSSNSSTFRNLMSIAEKTIAMTSLTARNIKKYSGLSDDNDINEDSIDEKEDINNAYMTEIFGFDIYSEKYKYRILTLYNSITFPIMVIPEEGITKELSLDESRKEISSNEEMKEFLKDILSSKKVNNVINQMRVLINIDKEENILSIMKTHPEGLSVLDLAKELKWSQRITRDKIEELSEKGKIKNLGNEKRQIWVLKM